MKIGYCSPFNPQSSGISDFSEELVQALSHYIDVVILSPVKPSNQKLSEFSTICRISDLENDSLRNSLDILVYHIGNNYQMHRQILTAMERYPGILELHDVGLHHLVAGKSDETHDWKSYISLAKYCHGKRGEKIVKDFFTNGGSMPWDTHPIDMCMTRPYIEGAKGIIVHSEFAKQMVLGICDTKPIVNIMHHTADIQHNPEGFKKICRKKLNLPEGQLVMGSFGFATQSKRIIQILDALKKFKETYTTYFVYLVVGQAQKELEITQRINERALDENVLVTGFTELEDFKTYMGACDFCLNLRYPTQGESSGSLHRMFGMGKPAIVTDIGTFSDYPDEVVRKVSYGEHEVEEIYQAIYELSRDKKQLKRRSQAALQFAKTYCDIEKNAKVYADFFESVQNGTWQPEEEDVLIGRLCELGLTDDSYTAELWEKIHIY